jgi:hypothetical protein
LSPTATGSFILTPGQSRILWPAAVAVKDGDSYKLSWDGATAPTTVKFVVVQPVGDMQAMADTLLKAGCKPQVDQVMDTASTAKPAPKG